MSTRPNLLSTTTLILRILIGLNFLFGAGIAAFFVISLIIPDWLLAALGFQAETSMTGLRLLMLIGLAGVPLAYLILARLLAMVGTVQSGDPFVPENARRLLVVAQAQLAIQLLQTPAGLVCGFFSIKLDVPIFTLNGWLPVLLTFVLARVFDAGTRMRADLEGTV